MLSCCCAETGDSWSPTALKTQQVFEAPVILDDPARQLPQKEAVANDSGGLLGKLTAPMAPPQPPQEEKQSKVFTVRLRLEKGQEAGFGLDFAEGHFIRVCRLFGRGPVAVHNSTAPPECRIEVGDFLVRVRGEQGSATGSTSIVECLQAGGDLELDISRPYEFVIAGLDRTGGTAMGLDLSYHPRGTAVAVRALLEEGLVPQHNRYAAPHEQLRVSDYIIAVNGSSGGAREIVDALSSPSVTLTVARPHSAR